MASRYRERRNSEPYASEHDAKFLESSSTYGGSSQVYIFQEHSVRMHRTVSNREKHQRHSTGDNKEERTTELSTDEHMPGMLKIFGDTIFPSVQYKTVLASCRSTAKELVKQALERYGISIASHGDYVLCDVVGKWLMGIDDIHYNAEHHDKDQPGWHRIYSHELAGKDKPLLLQQFWRPVDGLSRRYELRRSCEFAEDVDNDDTFGLNENARKISIAKLRPGAIPVQLHSDNLDGERFSEDLKWDYTFSRLESPRQANEPRTKVLERLVSDKPNDIVAPVVDEPRSVSLPVSNHMVESQGRSCLVTVRSPDVKHSAIIYPIDTNYTVIGNGKEQLDRAKLISLDAPDVAPIHCFLYLRKCRRSIHDNCLDDKFTYYLDIEPCSMAAVAVNGWPITSMTKITSGDTLSVGKKYVFIFKDNACSGNENTQTLWQTNKLDEDHCSESSSVPQIHVTDLNEEFLLSPLSPTSDDGTFYSIESATDREELTFPFRQQKEDQLLKAISTIIQLNPSAFALTSAYLYGMCIEHSWQHKPAGYFCRKVIISIKENVKRLIKVLSENPLESGLLPWKFDNPRNEHLWNLLRWLSNCVQLSLYLKNGPFNDWHGHRDETGHLMLELSQELDDIVTSCFQQIVYTITKVIYALLPLVMDSNPFNNKANRRHTHVEKLIAVFDVIAEQTANTRLHISVSRQLFSYLFFFTSTSIFNRIFSKETGSKYHNWESGVRIRANLSHLEDWSSRNELQKEFSKMFEKLVTASELLSTSKTILMKYDWTTMKENFRPLNECQLYRMLRGYQRGKGHPAFPWQPSPEDIDVILREDSLLIDMSSHPPFIAPDKMSGINLRHLPDDTSFWTHFRQLRSLYATAEDSSDSGYTLLGKQKHSGNSMDGACQRVFYSQMSSMAERTGIKTSTSRNRKVKFRDHPEFFGSNSPFTYKKGLTICGTRISSVDSQTSQDDYASDWSAQSSDLTSDWSNRSLQFKQDKRLAKIVPVGQYVDHQQRRNKSPQCFGKSENDIKKWRDNVNERTSPECNQINKSSVLCKENYMIAQKKNDLIETSTRLLDSPGDSGIEFLADLLFDEDQVSASDDAHLQNSKIDSDDIHKKIPGCRLYNVSLTKVGTDIGLGLVDGLCTPLKMAGVYIKQVVTETPAAECRHLEVGDRLLSLNGQSIFGCEFQSVVNSIRTHRGCLSLLVAKGNDSIATKIAASIC